VFLNSSLSTKYVQTVARPPAENGNTIVLTVLIFVKREQFITAVAQAQQEDVITIPPQKTEAAHHVSIVENGAITVKELTFGEKEFVTNAKEVMERPLATLILKKKR